MDDVTIVIIVAALFAISEALSLSPAIRANGVFQLIYGILRLLTNKNK